jgi:hypothetical protein
VIDHASARARRSAIAIVLVAGAIWACLCLILYRAGHAPSRTLVPIARADYYLYQACFVVPLLLAQWCLASAVARRIARALGGSGEARQLTDQIAPALALPLILLFLAPDLLTYAWLGFSALAKLVRITAPLSFLGSVWLGTRAVRRTQGLRGGRALLAAFLAVLAQSLVGGVLLR